MLTPASYAERQTIHIETLEEKLQQAKHDYDYALKMYDDACTTEANPIILECRALTCGALLADLRKIEAEIINNLCQKGGIEDLEKILEAKNKNNKADRRAYLESFAPEALHHSCAGNKIRITAFLLALNLTQKQDGHGYYPLHYACLHEDETKTELLLGMLLPNDDSITSGQIIADSIGPNHDTPLHTAASCGNQSAVRYLIAQGANPLLTNHQGFSVLQQALLHRHYKVAEFLGECGVFLDPLEYHALYAKLQSDFDQCERLKEFLGSGIFPITKTPHGHLPLFFARPSSKHSKTMKQEETQPASESTTAATRSPKTGSV